MFRQAVVSRTARPPPQLPIGARSDRGPARRGACVKRHGKMPQRALFAWTAALRGHIDAEPALAAAAIVH
jgi:hypothetical protein